MKNYNYNLIILKKQKNNYLPNKQNQQNLSKLSNEELAKIKADLINESISINNEINKRRKRYKSILLINNNEHSLSKRLNDKNKYGILKNYKKNKNKNNYISNSNNSISMVNNKTIFDVMKKRGIKGNTLNNNEKYENMNTDNERERKVKFK